MLEVLLTNLLTLLLLHSLVTTIVVIALLIELSYQDHSTIPTSPLFVLYGTVLVLSILKSIVILLSLPGKGRCVTNQRATIVTLLFFGTLSSLSVALSVGFHIFDKQPTPASALAWLVMSLGYSVLEIIINFMAYKILKGTNSEKGTGKEFTCNCITVPGVTLLQIPLVAECLLFGSCAVSLYLQLRDTSLTLRPRSLLLWLLSAIFSLLQAAAGVSFWTCGSYFREIHVRIFLFLFFVIRVGVFCFSVTALIFHWNFYYSVQRFGILVVGVPALPFFGLVVTGFAFNWAQRGMRRGLGKTVPLLLRAVENDDLDEMNKDTPRTREIIRLYNNPPFVCLNYEQIIIPTPKSTSLLDATEPLQALIPNIDSYTFHAINSFQCPSLAHGVPSPHEALPYGVTLDEAAAIYLHVLEWGEKNNKSLCSVLNQQLKLVDREAMRPFFPFLSLFLVGLEKLPKFHGTICRGVPQDLSEDYIPEMEVKWWAFSNCTTDEKRVLMYLDSCCQRTVFIIHCKSGVKIQGFSKYTFENEILLSPVVLQVKGRLSPSPGLHVIELVELGPLLLLEEKQP